MSAAVLGHPGRPFFVGARVDTASPEVAGQMPVAVLSPELPEEGYEVRTRKRQIVGMVAMAAVLLSLAGCGGGGGEDAPANRSPSADAGEDQTVAAGSRVTLDGSGSSDADGAIAGYQWEQTSGPNAALSNADQASVSFVAPEVDADTTLTFRLTVTDDDGATASDEVSVMVQPQTPANQPPSANAGPDQTVEAGSVVVLVGSGSDVDGAIASSQWEQTDGSTVSLSNQGTLLASFVAPEVAADTTLTFRLTVTDDDGATASDEVSVMVQPVDTGEAFVLDVSHLDDPDFRLQ